MRSVLKWVGGKSTLMGSINRILPKGNRLIEPFTGSCAVTMNTAYDSYIVADINQDLIGMYRMVRDAPDSLVAIVRDFYAHANSADDYYRLRDVFNQRTSDKQTQAALFIYLNRHGYRGLCRYSKKKGTFNVPYGHYKAPLFPEKEIYHLSEKLQNATLLCAGFQETLSMAQPGDVVYCDPPYVEKGRFTDYHSSGFNMSHLRELVGILESMMAKGVSVVASSHNEEAIREIYAGFSQTELTAFRSIGVKGGSGKRADELLLSRIAFPLALPFREA